MRLLVALALLAGCGHARPPAPAGPACLVEAPPPERRVVLAGPDRGCPAQFAACLDVQAALALERTVVELRRYARAAWAACGPLPGAP